MSCELQGAKLESALRPRSKGNGDLLHPFQFLGVLELQGQVSSIRATFDEAKRLLNSIRHFSQKDPN